MEYKSSDASMTFTPLIYLFIVPPSYEEIIVRIQVSAIT